MPRYIGKSIPRLEDERFVTGRGRYTNDIPPPDACWAYVLRSPQAHARIRAIRLEAARTRPGVLAGQRVRFVGEPVALIVAQTLDQARDAAEAVEVDYEMLPAVVSIADALN